jgi:hypothetical protein
MNVMETILTNIVGETLTFNQPSLIKRQFELVSSKTVLAKMVFPKLFSSRVVVEGFDGKWEFKSLSIWQREFGIFKYGYQMPYAKYISNFWRTKGTLELPKGARLYCKSVKFKKPFEIFSSEGSLILSYSNRFALMGRTSVTIEKRSELLDKYPCVILLGWYIIVQNRKGRASAAG